MAIYTTEKFDDAKTRYGTRRTFTTSDGSTVTGTYIGGGAFIRGAGRRLTAGAIIFFPSPYEPIGFDKSYQTVQSPDNPGVREVVFSGYGEPIPVSIGKRLLTSNVIDATPLEPRLVGYREWYELVKEPADENQWGCSGESWSIEGTYSRAWGNMWNFNVILVTGQPPSAFCWWQGYNGNVMANSPEEAVEAILARCGCGIEG